MSCYRNTILCMLALLAVQGPAIAQVARDTAADYPNKTVRLVVPFTPGASNDITSRLIAGKLVQAWGQQIVIDNRAGAGGAVGAETVARATPDGYTLLASNPGPNVNNPVMLKKPGYHVEDFSSVVIYGYTPLIIAANPSFKPRNPRELADYLKANPAAVSWGSTGTGGSAHIALALFQVATGVDVIHVPYKGAAPGLNELVGGMIPLFYTTLTSADVHIKSGRLRILGVAAPKRLTQLPEAPTLAEFGIKNAEAINWFGLAAPAKTPRAIIDKLNREVNRVMAMPDVRVRMDQLGVETFGGSASDADEFVRKEVVRLRQLMQTGLIAPIDG